MGQKIFYHNSQQNRSDDGRFKRWIFWVLVILVLLFMVLVLVGIFGDSARRQEMSDALRENSEMKIQLADMQEQIDTLTEENGRLRLRTGAGDISQEPEDVVSLDPPAGTTPEASASPKATKKPARATGKPTAKPSARPTQKPAQSPAGEATSQPQGTQVPRKEEE